MRIWTASLVFAMRFIPMTKADFTITHIFRENPTAQKWVGALHGVNLLKRRKTIKEDKHMSTEMTVAFIMFENIDFNALIEKATKEKCEITISYEPNRTEITIQPWKPFSYACPYKAKQED